MTDDSVVDRLIAAINDHDVEAMAACLHEDYRSEQPLHPEAGFSGPAQVKENWSAMFEEIPDLACDVLRTALSGNEVWSELHVHGRHKDGSDFHYRGVVICGITGSLIETGRFYFETVQQGGPDIEGRTKEILGKPQ